MLLLLLFFQPKSLYYTYTLYILYCSLILPRLSPILPMSTFRSGSYTTFFVHPTTMLILLIAKDKEYIECSSYIEPFSSKDAV